MIKKILLFIGLIVLNVINTPANASDATERIDNNLMTFPILGNLCVVLLLSSDEAYTSPRCAMLLVTNRYFNIATLIKNNYRVMFHHTHSSEDLFLGRTWIKTNAKKTDFPNIAKQDRLRTGLKLTAHYADDSKQSILHRNTIIKEVLFNDQYGHLYLLDMTFPEGTPLSMGGVFVCQVIDKESKACLPRIEDATNSLDYHLEMKKFLAEFSNLFDE